MTKRKVIIGSERRTSKGLKVRTGTARAQSSKAADVSGSHQEGAPPPPYPRGMRFQDQPWRLGTANDTEPYIYHAFSCTAVPTIKFNLHIRQRKKLTT